MEIDQANIAPAPFDPVSNVLKWILLAVAIGSFALLGWATVETYRQAPPQPDLFLASSGATLMSEADIFDGKAGFQKADLMDYGSLYGMGSYYGEDYTADTLVRMATLTQDELSQARYGKTFNVLTVDQQAPITNAMRAQLQDVDLTKARVTLPDALAKATIALQKQIAATLNTLPPGLL